MQLTLGLMAGCLFLIYSVYFARILKGTPQLFEIELLKALADWMVQKGARSKRALWLMLLASVVLEALYFGMTLMVIDNPAMVALTFIMAGMECFHLTNTAVNFRRFFASQSSVSQLINWRLERISATMFFTHSFLVMAILLFF